MDWLLRLIIRMRKAPEPTRYFILWTVTGVAIIVIGILWAMTFSLNLAVPYGEQRAAQKIEEEEKVTVSFLPESFSKRIQRLRANLPSIRDLLTR